MKATGIVRRIDDLGRIVIPKETRRMMGIAEGDPVEIFMEGKNIVLTAYFPEDERIGRIRSLLENISNDQTMPAVSVAAISGKLEAVIAELEGLGG